MRKDLLGLPLGLALERLSAEGIAPQVKETFAPRRRDETRGGMRVVYASDDGASLTVSRFIDPIADSRQELDR